MPSRLGCALALHDAYLGTRGPLCDGASIDHIAHGKDWNRFCIVVIGIKLRLAMSLEFHSEATFQSQHTRYKHHGYQWRRNTKSLSRAWLAQSNGLLNMHAQASSSRRLRTKHALLKPLLEHGLVSITIAQMPRCFSGS